MMRLGLNKYINSEIRTMLNYKLGIKTERLLNTGLLLFIPIYEPNKQEAIISALLDPALQELLTDGMLLNHQLQYNIWTNRLELLGVMFYKLGLVFDL